MRNTRPTDSSLIDPTQRALAAPGFSQFNFSDSLTDWPLSGGTTTRQGRLDLCGANRRQVFVS